MSKIYVPTPYKNNCNVFNNNYIRSYTNNTHTEWVDIYFTQDYALKNGNSSYNNNVSCDSLNTYTDVIYYRYDFSNIIICTFILIILFFYFPYKICSRFFGRWLKL